MDNSQTLEMQILAKSEEALKSLDKLITKLTGVEKGIENISKDIGKVDNSNINSTSKNFDNVDKSVKKATKSMQTFKNAFTLVGIKRLTQTMLGWMDNAIDQTEQLNLFNVVFKNIEKNGVKMYSTLGREATRFQYQMNEAFGTNKTETLKYQALFQSMAENMGIGETYSTIMSESMTKLTYDLASLYNKTETATAEALRASVYAGQTKPGRTYGLDTTQQSLQPILDELGIERTVKQMSQAEKQILRYLAVMKQSKVAHGDFANTIESPANQLKIFKQQLVETKVALSSLFMGAFANIVPYANAFLMIIKEVTKAIADMFGIELTDYNSGIASQEDAFADLEEGVNGATGAIKELKRQTLGFDQINNINENNDNGGNGTLTGGIDQRLLDAIKGYDNGMDQVRMKATEIRDKIMEWLGFTKEVDSMTGEVSFKYANAKDIIKNLWNGFKKLNPYVKTFVGLGVATIIKKIFDNSSGLNKALGNTGMLGVVKSILSPMKSLYNSLDDVNYANKNLTQGLGEGITNWSKSLTILDKFKVTLVGIAGLSMSMQGMKDAMASVSDEGWNLNNSLGAVVSGLGGIASGAYIGSMFGPWGTAIGGVAGAIADLVGAISGYETESEKMVARAEDALEISNQKLQEYYDTKQAIEDAMNGELAQTDYHQRLLDELNSLVDANGKVKKGYEDRVNFILTELNTAYGTEYSIIDGTIDGYDGLNEKIKEVIQTKKSEIMLEAERENYINAIKGQKQAWVEYQDAIKNYNETNTQCNDLLNEKNKLEKIAYTNAMRNYTYTSKLTGEVYKGQAAYYAITKDLETYEETLKDNWDTLGNHLKVFSGYTEDITFYEDLQTAVLSENVEEQNRLIEEKLNAVEKNGEEEKLTLSEQIQFYRDVANQKLAIYESNGIEITDEMKKQTEEQIKELTKGLVEQSDTIEKLSPDIISSWSDLATNSKDEFLDAFGQLDKDIQQEVIDKMYDNGVKISSELEEGIKSINPTVNIKANVSSAENTITTWISGLGGTLQKIFPNISSLFKKADGGIYSNGNWKNIQQYAGGGLPSHGTMFVAGEAGAEVVGNINGRTEVLNQSQIASAIYSAVVSAMSNSGSQIDVHVHTDEGTVVDRINQKTKQTGVCPITIV